MSNTVFFQYDDAGNSQLASMGLSGELLNQSLRIALGQFKNTTAFHAPNAPGTYLYHALIVALRETHVPSGWEYSDKGLSLIYNRHLRMAIAVSSGNEHVGNPLKRPSFRYPKGPATEAAVSSNVYVQSRFDFAPVDSPAATESLPEPDFSSLSTWWLLHHVFPSREMTAELSLPMSVHGGTIDQFDTRIILDPIPFDDDPEVTQIGGPEAPMFDVPVRKKV